MCNAAWRRGLEKALDRMEVGAEQAVAPAANGRQHAATPRDVRRVVMRERRAAAWRNLHVLERDVIIVFSALCKVRRGRRAGVTFLIRFSSAQRLCIVSKSNSSLA